MRCLSWLLIARFLMGSLPAGISLFLFDLCNIVINRLASGHGDIQLAAIGIVLKAERLPLNVGIGICLGMTPLALVAGLRHARRDVRGAALCLFAAAAAKFLLFDQAGAPTPERVAGFLGVGLLLLLGSAVYIRSSAREKNQ